MSMMSLRQAQPPKHLQFLSVAVSAPRVEYLSSELSHVISRSQRFSSFKAFPLLLPLSYCLDLHISLAWFIAGLFYGLPKMCSSCLINFPLVY